MHAPSVPDGETSLRDVYRILFRRKGLLIGFFSLTMLAGAAFALLYPKTYRSEARLFVRLGRENVGLDPTTNLDRTASVSIPTSREEELNTIVAVLNSRSLLEKAVDAIGPEAILAWGAASSAPAKNASRSSWMETMGLSPRLSARDRAMLKLGKSVSIEWLKKTNVILVACEGPNPEFSQTIALKLVDLCLEQHLRSNRAPHAHEFVGEQLTTKTVKLAALENELRDLKNSTGLSSVDEQRRTLIAQVARVEDEFKTTQALVAATDAETRALKARLNELKETRVVSSAAGFPNIAADGIRQQLFTLQVREKELASRVTDRHAELHAVQDQLAALKSIAATLDSSRTQVTTGPDRISEELRLQLFRQESMLASLHAKAAALEVQMSGGARQLKSLNDNEVRLARLQREIQIQSASYQKYNSALEQARIDESLERERISNITVAQPPTFNSQPIRPQPATILALAFAIGLFGGVAIAFLAEQLNHSFKTADEIESRLNLPVLVSIPWVRRMPAPETSSR